MLLILTKDGWQNNYLADIQNHFSFSFLVYFDPYINKHL
jgi:hypothetical protein